jgi:hypothetical protein
MNHEENSYFFNSIRSSRCVFSDRRCICGNLCCNDDDLCVYNERSVHELHYLNVLHSVPDSVPDSVPNKVPNGNTVPDSVPDMPSSKDRCRNEGR